MHKLFTDIKQEISKVIVGQDELVESIIIALLSGGHILLEGMPGLAKTTTVKTIAKALGVSNTRVQFTPDLLPSDIIGAEIYNPKSNEFSIKKGPVFTNLLLADEINRAPAKVQSALLEAMAEKQVTIAQETYTLTPPFIVMATQNPIETEGTHKLPEAQLDRFMMKISLEYNTYDEELEVLNLSENPREIEITQVLSHEDILNASQAITAIHVDDALKKYILDIIFATRKHEQLLFGASPRGGIDLLRIAKAKAFIAEREYVTPADILSSAHAVLRHRVILSYEARAQGVSSDDILTLILEEMPIP